MKCLSLWQPWATLISIGAKRIETRGWPTSYRGPLAIHAAKKWDRELWGSWNDERFLKASEAALGYPLLEETDVGKEPTCQASALPRGRILCTCRLVGVAATADIHKMRALDGVIRISRNYQHDEDLRITDRELAFGDYSFGRFAGILTDVRPLPAPIPYTGRQGLFDVPDALLRGEQPAAGAVAVEERTEPSLFGSGA